jgi:hypothetical protein
MKVKWGLIGRKTARGEKKEWGEHNQITLYTLMEISQCNPSL